MTRVTAIRKAIVSEKSGWVSLTLSIGAIGTAIAIRWALSTVGATLTFATFFPAVLISALLCGWRYGAACAFFSGFIASGLFPQRSELTSLSATGIANIIVFWLSAAVIVATAAALQRAVRDLDEADLLASYLNRELQHRVANTLTVVQAIASQSATGASSQEFIAAFSGRIQALNKANRLLGKHSLDTCALPDLIDVACEPFCKEENIIKNGPPCELPAVSCVPLVLALHELCTNALKYGALSVPGGRADITWDFGATPHRLTIRWEEIGGPPVDQPSRQGLGSRLLKRQPGLAEVELTFARSGVRCMMAVDGAKLLGPLNGTPGHHAGQFGAAA